MRQKGFTLIEAMTVIALVAIVTTMAVPMFTSMMANARLTAATNDIVGSLAAARSAAVKFNRVTRIAPMVGVDWSTGYRVTHAGPDNAIGTADDVPVAQFEAIHASLTVTRSVAYNNLDFIASGSRPIGSPTITITLCSSVSKSQRVLTLSAMGSVATQQGDC